MSAQRKRVVVLISGRGSNMEALAAAAAAPDYPAAIVGVIADSADAGGLEIARSREIAAIAVPRSAHAGKAAHESAVCDAIDVLEPDFICLAGYMRLLSGAFIARYRGRIVNIHPSLLPLFPGLETHRRALDAGVRVHGCSVHFVTEGMDEGPLIAQGALPVRPDDTPETLAERVLAVEHRLYPAALAMLARGDVRMGDDGKSCFTPGSASQWTVGEALISAAG